MGDNGTVVNIRGCRHINLDDTKVTYDLTVGVDVMRWWNLADNIISVVW